MDSLQEHRQEFHAILESDVINLQLEAVTALINELDTPSNPYETTKQYTARLGRLKDLYGLKLSLLEERENFMNSFPSREAYLLHCAMEEHK